METSEIELIKQLVPTHAELRHLVQQHRSFEEELGRLERIRFPTEAERREINKIKRLKLRGKDRIAGILKAHTS
ncbi:MAG: DUF465 domain-containing protein [Myxococcota bacterium]